MAGNAARHSFKSSTDYAVDTPGWRVNRVAYDEVRDGLPPDYDRDWRKAVEGRRHCLSRGPLAYEAVQRVYERTREACLVLKLAGRLPAWPRNQRVPREIERTLRELAQEARVGREANLVVTLTPPPVVAGAELATVY